MNSELYPSFTLSEMGQSLFSYIDENSDMGPHIIGMFYGNNTFVLAVSREMTADELNLHNAPIDWLGIAIEYRYMGNIEHYVSASFRDQ